MNLYFSVNDASTLSTFIVAATAAAIGSFIGGAASFCVAFYQANRSDTDKNLIHLSSIKFKLEKIRSISMQTFNYINNILDLSGIRPSINTEKLLSFSYDSEYINYENDLAVVIRCSRGHNVNVFIEVQERYRSLIDLLNVLKEKRRSFHAIMMKGNKIYNKDRDILETTLNEADGVEAEMLIRDISDIAFDIYQNIIYLNAKLISARNSHSDLIKLNYPSHHNLYIK